MLKLSEGVGVSTHLVIRRPHSRSLYRFKAGKAQMFTGPVKDNKGNVKIPAAQVGDPSLVSTIDWYVAGVVGQGSK